MNTVVLKPARALLSGVVALGLSGALSTAAIAPASAVAAPASVAASVATAAPVASVLTAAQGATAIKIASSKKGAPYRWGAMGPNAFDCSGYTSWVFARLGKKLPRTANAQYVASIKISKKSARPGDLVFFGSGRKYHVGIYAGNGMMWHAPNSRSVVKLAKVYSSSATFGRVR